jgi:hypothetical protein
VGVVVEVLEGSRGGVVVEVGVGVVGLVGVLGVLGVAVVEVLVSVVEVSAFVAAAAV